MKGYRNPDERAVEARALRHRLLSLLPAGTYALDRFLSLADVVVDEATGSACVTVGALPTMHLNARFVSKYCKRDEHLLMLVMHELYHVILGHTGHWPRLTPAHNIAFDAVINALLCRRFPGEVYAGFFRRLNPADRFPGRLLRPPDGWPREGALPAGLSPAERRVMANLYSGDTLTATHQEILDLVAAHARDIEGEVFVLIGDHGADARSCGGAGETDPLMRDLVGRMVQEWPEHGRASIGRSLGGDLLSSLLPRSRTPRGDFAVALKRLLRRAGVLHPGGGRPHGWTRMPCEQEAVTALPNWRDRHAEGRSMLLNVPPLLYRVQAPSTRLRWSPRDVAHVYLDISGSMDDCIPWLVGALGPLHQRGLLRTFVFSTMVDEVRRGRMDLTKVRNTGGTDIRCVYDHLLSLSRRATPSRVVVLTDGYTGAPAPEQHSELAARGVSLFVGVTLGGSGDQLSRYAAHVEYLPALA